MFGKVSKLRMETESSDFQAAPVAVPQSNISEIPLRRSAQMPSLSSSDTVSHVVKQTDERKTTKTVVQDGITFNNYSLQRVEIGPFFARTLTELDDQGLTDDSILIRQILQRLSSNRCFICSGVGHRDTKCSQKARLIKLGSQIRRGFERIISDGFKDLLNYENSTRTAITLQKPSSYSPLEQTESYEGYQVQKMALEREFSSMLERKKKKIEI